MATKTADKPTTGKPLADGGAVFTPPQRIFKTAAQVEAVKVWKPGDFEANGHNVVIDWRDPATLAIGIGTDAEALANVYQGAKGGVALARTDGTRYGAFLAETPDGRRWYVKVSADLVKEAKGK